VTTSPAQILALHDAGQTVSAIASSANVSQGYVYALLRAERPERKRAPRTRTSEVPAKIRFLSEQGIGAARVAVLLGVSRAYVYRVISER
jgi:hypothetical protein